MKKLIYLLSFSFLFFACETDSDNEGVNNQDETSFTINTTDSKSTPTNCEIIGPSIVQAGTTEIYSFDLPNVQGTSLISLIPADGALWKFGENLPSSEHGGNLTREIIFGPNFTCGEITLVSNNGCPDSLFVGIPGNCNCESSNSTYVDIDQTGQCPGDIFSFYATPNGGEKNGSYIWSVSRGRITSGQGSRRIHVETPSSGGFMINVTFTSDCGQVISGANLAEFSASCDDGGGFGF